MIFVVLAIPLRVCASSSYKIRPVFASITTALFADVVGAAHTEIGEKI
jgi:hypothetical protein